VTAACSAVSTQPIAMPAAMNGAPATRCWWCRWRRRRRPGRTARLRRHDADGSAGAGSVGGAAGGHRGEGGGDVACGVGAERDGGGGLAAVAASESCTPARGKVGDLDGASFGRMGGQLGDVRANRSGNLSRSKGPGVGRLGCLEADRVQESPQQMLRRRATVSGSGAGRWTGRIRPARRASPRRHGRRPDGPAGPDRPRPARRSRSAVPARPVVARSPPR
jgi:hypothetical protein